MVVTKFIILRFITPRIDMLFEFYFVRHILFLYTGVFGCAVHTTSKTTWPTAAQTPSSDKWALFNHQVALLAVEPHRPSQRCTVIIYAWQNSINSILYSMIVA